MAGGGGGVEEWRSGESGGVRWSGVRWSGASSGVSSDG